MQPPDAAARLRSAFISLGSPADESLRDAVCAYVDERKHLGVRAERIMVEIKRIAHAAREAMFSESSYSFDAAKRLDVALQRAITWCSATAHICRCSNR